jgi:hypothetical protein
MMGYRKAVAIVFVAAALTLAIPIGTPIAVAQEIVQPFILKVSDANAQRIGWVQGFITGSLSLAIVSLKVNGVPLPLLVSHSQFFGNSSAFFESKDCTGAVLVKSVADLMVPTVVLHPGNSVHVADMTHPDENITTRSVIHHLDPERRCLPFTETSLRHRTFPLMDLNTRYVPPFSIR